MIRPREGGPVPILYPDPLGEEGGAINPEDVDLLPTVAAMAAAVEEMGYRALRFPVRDSLLPVLEAARLAREKSGFVLNLCEAYAGSARFEMHVAALLDLEEAPFTGAGPGALFLCQDKWRARAVLRAEGIPVAPAVMVRPGESSDGHPPFPLIVKPAREDGSFGVHRANVVRSEEELRRAVARVSEEVEGPVLAERFLPGREFNVAMLGNGPARMLPPSQIDFSRLPEGAPPIVTYEGKWLPDHDDYRGTVPRCPASIERGVAGRLQRAAQAAFRSLELRDYGRIDFREDEEGRLFVIDVNPNPDLGLDAGFARAASTVGLDYAGLIQAIVQAALERIAPPEGGPS